ncbi:hypothetical protein [Ilumatobacter nonamiensis]|uniref:hypothetical protein n=1 Tax=Ilumatobacter nonamiensis TaxID=467093 RepID=UPI0003450A22|nr:hypothetical protein [Ilumatobacter nonamiensis]
MATDPDVPQFGALLRDHIQSVPAESQPAFLAGLERSAADRYREWAERLPDHSEALLGCAASEDRIADIVTGLFPIGDEARAEIDAALPAAVALYYDVFAPYSVRDQLYLQSEAEIQGSQAWVRISGSITDAGALAALRECTDLELQSSAVAKKVLEDLDAASS